jgi:GAF domain-containing protein/HAMP domain-containing protein
MSVITPNSPEARLKNLIRVARLSAVLGITAGILYIYLGISTENWYSYLVAGSFFLISFVAFVIDRTSQIERPIVGVWHLLATILLAALLISVIQANAGAEVGSAALIVVLVIVIQTLPPEHTVRGAIVGAIASLICGVLAFYSPLQQTTDTNADVAITWIARFATLAFLAMVMVRFRSISLANKLLISFLGVVVIISLTFNFVMTATTTDTLTNQIGQQLYSSADGRSILIGDYLNAQIEVLKTLALDETIRQSVIAANALEPKLEDILLLDEQWRQTVAAGTQDSFVNSRLTNSLSSNLRAFQAISPEHVEVFVTDNMGALVAATSMTSDYYQADEAWWQSAYRERDAYISLPVVDESVGVLSIQLAVPVYNTRQGDLIGVLRTTLSIDSLISIIDDPIGDTGEAYLYLSDQSVLDVNQSQYVDIAPDSMVAIENSASQTFLRSFFEGEEKIMARKEIRSQAASSKVNALDWSMIVTQDTSEALGPVRKQVRIISFFGTIMAGVSAFLSLMVAQRLASPIINLTHTANQISQGDLEARAIVNSHDEIGQLADSFNAMTTQLQENLVGLEERVSERTAELEKSTQQLTRRAHQFEAIAQLGRTITSIQDLETLLPQIVQLVSQHFGFYHVGIFLLDESQQYAVLSAANSEGGQRMLARKHRLGVGKTGIVGYTTATGTPRIALDTGVDAVYFDNPDLPNTRSEMALPLRVGRTIIGALDVQSTEPNAFLEDDIEVLTILADEVSIAIENARLFEESQRVLADAQTAVGKYTLEAWQKIVNQRNLVGYELSGATVRPLEEPVKTNGVSTKIPITLRDRVVGSMNISMPDEKELDPDQVDIAQAFVLRVGSAIENATFLEEFQKSAVKEQVISEITGKIGSSINLRNVLQTAVEELGRNIPGSEIVIELKNHQDQPQGLFPGENK